MFHPGCKYRALSHSEERRLAGVKIDPKTVFEFHGGRAILSRGLNPIIHGKSGVEKMGTVSTFGINFALKLYGYYSML